jgi:demethylmenaquinone methyltransferase/2-methoxy-6-polyprenyl-1,4-benzoquinol methylase
MLRLAVQKARQSSLASRVEFVEARAESLPFAGSTFDAASVAFGVRNFEELETGLAEILRVLKPGGTLVVLEFSAPSGKAATWFFSLYLERFLPSIGGAISGNPAAYEYLPRTMKEFPSGDRFVSVLELAGFAEVWYVPVSSGIATIYTAKKHPGGGLDQPSRRIRQRAS